MILVWEFKVYAAPQKATGEKKKKIVTEEVWTYDFSIRAMENPLHDWFLWMILSVDDV